MYLRTRWLVWLYSLHLLRVRRSPLRNIGFAVWYDSTGISCNKEKALAQVEALKRLYPGLPRTVFLEDAEMLFYSGMGRLIPQ